MPLFDAEKIVTNLIRSLGVEPKDFVAFITMARDEFMAIRADRLAFKPASQKAYIDMIQRLDAIADHLKRVEERLDHMHRRIILIDQTEEPEHERNDFNGH